MIEGKVEYFEGGQVIYCGVRKLQYTVIGFVLKVLVEEEIYTIEFKLVYSNIVALM
jgi:hypothetical protein